MSIVAGAGSAGPAAAGKTAPADDHVAAALAPEHPEGHPATTPAPVRTPRTLAAAGDLLRALAAPVRISIVLQLLESDRCVHDLVDALGVAQPLISQHLRVLKAAGVVQGERRGREVVYSLVDDHLAHIVVDAVEHVEEGQ
jgi:ArsR family transcriptional regulator, zinc-responsive transcriptional repressor